MGTGDYGAEIDGYPDDPGKTGQKRGSDKQVTPYFVRFSPGLTLDSNIAACDRLV